MTRLALTVRSLALVLLASAVACGTPPERPPARSGGSERVDAATAGRVSGRVRFSGTPPAAELLRMGTDAACAAVAGPDPRSDAVLITSDGALQNAFVWLKSGLDPKYGFPVPETPVVLDQVGCRYTPRVVGLRVGQPLEVLNSDDTMHNVHGMPNLNVEFNQSTPIKGTSVTRTFSIPEVMVRFTCNVHTWMTAHVGVVEHPFFAVSGADGWFEIPGLPPGAYTIEAWHERFGRLTQQVTVAERATVTASFTFSG